MRCENVVHDQTIVIESLNMRSLSDTKEKEMSTVTKQFDLVEVNARGTALYRQKGLQGTVYLNGKIFGVDAPKVLTVTGEQSAMPVRKNAVTPEEKEAKKAEKEAAAAKAAKAAPAKATVKK